MALRTLNLQMSQPFAFADRLVVEAGVVLDIVREQSRYLWNSGVAERYVVTSEQIPGSPSSGHPPQARKIELPLIL
jgi:hypothetical protein